MGKKPDTTTLEKRIAALGFLFLWVVLLIYFPLFVAIPRLFWKEVRLPVKFASGQTPNTSTIIIDKSPLETASLENIVRSAFRSSLDLSNYKYCFVNKSTAIEFDMTSKMLVQLNFFRNNETGPYRSVFLKEDESACEFFSIEETNSINVKSFYKLKFFPTQGSINIDVVPENSFAEPYRGDRLVSSFVFLLAWWGFVFICRGVIRLIYSSLTALMMVTTGKSTKPILHEELDKRKDGVSARYLPLGHIQDLGAPFKLKDKIIYEINFCPNCESNETYHHWIQQNGDMVGNVWRFEQFRNEQGTAMISKKYDYCLDCRKEFVIEIYLFEKISNNP